MGLIVLIGAQAVGKMSVGRELEQRINGKLLYNHQTIDLFANFLGYSQAAFQLSSDVRKKLFQAFVANKETNVTESIIFTVLIDFDSLEDIQFLRDIQAIFLQEQEEVFFVELTADIETRLKRNVQADRLLAKPSKRDIAFSEQELLSSHNRFRLESFEGEMQRLFSEIPYLKIENSALSPKEVAEKIIEAFQLKEGSNCENDT